MLSSRLLPLEEIIEMLALATNTEDQAERVSVQTSDIRGVSHHNRNLF